jgi:hypothetical protein
MIKEKKYIALFKFYGNYEINKYSLISLFGFFETYQDMLVSYEGNEGKDLKEKENAIGQRGTGGCTGFFEGGRVGIDQPIIEKSTIYFEYNDIENILTESLPVPNRFKFEIGSDLTLPDIENHTFSLEVVDAAKHRYRITL